jgi:branched-chain amino acid transport system ATP-binding protein
MGNPYLVLLDEPSEGVAPVIVEGMAQMILELKAAGQLVACARGNPRVIAALERGQILSAGVLPFPTIHAAVECFRASHPEVGEVPRA